MRPQFHDQYVYPHWSSTPRANQSRADYASPLTVYRHERSWRMSDGVICVLLIAVILALTVGVL